MMPVAGARRDATDRLIRALRAYLSETEIYIGTAGREVEMHRTDLTGLGVILDRGSTGVSTTPGQLSAALHLSAPATSAMLDRLERLGHIRRTPNPTDRRSVVVEITDHALAVGGSMFGRLGARMQPVLDRRSDDQLAEIADFLEDVVAATRAARMDLEGG